MKGGGGEEWNTRATGVQRRGIVTTWQSSLSLSLYLWIPQIFRRSDGQQIWIMYLQNLTWTSSSYQPAFENFILLLPPRERMDPFYSRVSNLGGWIFSSSSLR